MITQAQKSGKPEKFVSDVLKRINGMDGVKGDTGFAASLRRADNPATEYQSWEHLSQWCNLENDWERFPFAIVAASLARIKPEKDGVFGIGRAIAKSYEEKGKDGSEQDSAKVKIRRLLACKSAVEACEILRPLLSLIASRGVAINHAALLNDLLYFGNGEKIRLKWASDFYINKNKKEDI